VYAKSPAFMWMIPEDTCTQIHRVISDEEEIRELFFNGKRPDRNLYVKAAKEANHNRTFRLFGLNLFI
jgi:hypothetical protein